MKLTCAPMQGVTDYVFRCVHSRYFRHVDAYYTPFISPTQNRSFSNKEKREILPENNEGLTLVPQLLGHDGQDMLWAMRELRDMGYREVNLNLGCPSGTVVKKKKGSGLLSEPELLDNLLGEIFDYAPISVSVKTRIGVTDWNDWDAILELYNRYPIKELIIHPRITKQQYQGTVHAEAWAEAFRNSKNPLCYNGDIFTRKDASEFLTMYPDTSLMLGRGLIANPKLADEIAGEAPLTKEELQGFYEELYAVCRERIGVDRNILLHMKELWFYLGESFENNKKPMKAIRKAQSCQELEGIVSKLFAEYELKEFAGFERNEY